MDPEAQAFPSVVQLETVVVTCAQRLPVHTPEQHCDGELQAAPTVAHVAVTHVPETHESEQHSLGDVQDLLALLQNADDVHLPVEQTVEQHWESAVQVSPPTLHVGAGGGAQCRVPSHEPEQHSPGLLAVHVAPCARHVVGSTQ